MVRLFWNFNIRFVSIRGGYLLFLGVMAPTVFKLGAKRGQNGCIDKSTVERLFFIRFGWFFFHCVPYKILATKCGNRFDITLTVIASRGAKKGPHPKNQLFYFWSDFKIFFFIRFLVKIPACVFQADLTYLLPFSRY